MRESIWVLWVTYRKPGPLDRPGCVRLISSGLEAQCSPEVYRTVAVWPIDNTECLAEHIQRARWICLRITVGPARVIQKVVQTGKEFQARTLHDAERLGDRHIPLECVLVTDEQLLSKFTGRSVWDQERGIGSKIRANQLRVHTEPL